MTKVLRDLRAVWGRTALMVLAIGAGLLVFGGALYAGTIVDREFDRAYLATDPASATLVLRTGLGPDEAAKLSAAARGRPRVTSATMRAQFTAAFRPKDRPWSADPLQVFVAAPDDPMRVARFGVGRGGWPPPAHGIVIERDALAYLRLKVGDPLRVQAPGADPVTLTITNVAHDPSLADAAQEHKGYGYVSTDTLAALGQRPVLNELKITTGGDRGTVVRTARGVASWLAGQGVAVDEIQVPPPGVHPHRHWVDLILRVLYAFGGAVALLTAVLLAAMLNRLLSRQIPQIGIMKAIGAPTTVLVRWYLAMALLITVVATALAAVPGLLFGRALARMLLGMYDMDAASLAVPWWTYATFAAVGVLLAPLMALVPVTRAARTTVRAAMDHEGVRPGQESRYDWVGRLRGLGRVSLMSLRNLFRRRARLALLVGLLTLAGALFLGGAGTLTGLYAFDREATAQQRWDAEADLNGFAPARTITNAVARIPGVTVAEPWSVVPVAAGSGRTEVTATYPDQGHGATFLAAVPPTTSLLNVPLVQGRWLRPGDRDAVVLNAGGDGLAPDARLGDNVRITVDGRRTRWRVVGFVKQKFGGPSAFVTGAGFAAATGRPGQANRVEIGTGRHDPAARYAAADAARRVLTAAGVSVQLAMPVGRVGEVIDGHVYASAWTLLVVAVIIGLVGFVGMATSISTGVLERTREFAVMRAIGAKPRAVRWTVVTEGLFTALAGCLLAAPVALAVSLGLDTMIGQMLGGAPLPLRFSLVAAGAWAALVIIGAVAAALPPAVRASRITIRSALTRL